MANKLLIVAKREYLERVRSKWFIVMTLGVPVLLAGAMLLPILSAARGGASPSVRRIRIIDATEAGIGQRVAETLKADSSTRSDSVTGPFVVHATAANLAQLEAEATREVMKPKSLEGVLVLTDSTLSGKAARYAGRNASTISD